MIWHNILFFLEIDNRIYFQLLSQFSLIEKMQTSVIVSQGMEHGMCLHYYYGMKNLEKIYLNSEYHRQDKITYVRLNVYDNIQITVTRARNKDRNRVDLASKNGLFNSITYYLNDDQLTTDSGRLFFFDVYTYVCQFVEWFERKDVSVKFDREDVVNLMEQAIENRIVKDQIY